MSGAVQRTQPQYLAISGGVSCSPVKEPGAWLRSHAQHSSSDYESLSLGLSCGFLAGPSFLICFHAAPAIHAMDMVTILEAVVVYVLRMFSMTRCICHLGLG